MKQRETSEQSKELAKRALSQRERDEERRREREEHEKCASFARLVLV